MRMMTRVLGMRTSDAKKPETARSARELLADEIVGSGFPRTGMLNGVHPGRGRRKHSVETSVSNDTGPEGAGLAGRRAGGELEREYCEHLEALKFLIDPPPCFRNAETRQNFENRLNSLDLRLINTVAIPGEAAPTAASRRRRRGFRWRTADLCENGDLGSSYENALDRFADRAMIGLLVKAPILKSRPGEQSSPARENKTVRFKDEVERTGRISVDQRGGWRRREGEGCDGTGSNDRAKIEIPRERPHVRPWDDLEETRNGRWRGIRFANSRFTDGFMGDFTGRGETRGPRRKIHNSVKFRAAGRNHKRNGQ